jgi:hypothetical protein
MQCVSCGAETEAGASLTFFYSTRARSRGGIPNTEPAADQVLGIEEVFLCFLCQIAARHRAARKAALICGMLIGFALAVVGLTLFPSFFPAGSRFGAFLLSAPVVGMVDLLGNLVGLVHTHAA